MAKPPNVRFQSAVDLSVIHAAFVVATGGVCSDEKTQVALVRKTTEINTRLVSASVDVRAFWTHLFAATAAGQRLRDACSSALLAAGCSELQLDQTAASIGGLVEECRFAFQKRFPKLRDQLELRAGPLKDRWQTFGPGLLIEIAKQIWGSDAPSGWWPTKIDCLLVQPMRGGDGGIESSGGQLWIEAMLTDADPNVSEIFRLAFWITQLAVEKHLETKLGIASQPADMDDLGSGTHRVAKLPWQLGTVPVVLQAGRELELFRTPELPIARAIELWRLGGSDVADVVTSWWDQWTESRAAMPIALKALDRMLDPLRSDNNAAVKLDDTDLADLGLE